MKILRASNCDNLILTEITKKSKAYWNYSEEQIEKWSDALTISSEYISENETYKLVIDDQIIGYYSFVVNDCIATLDNMFISPEYIGRGFGKILMNDFMERISKTENKKIVLEAEPNAESFYKKFGFTVTSKIESSIKERFLPIMEIDLKNK